MTGTILTGYQYTPGKVENAQDKVQDQKIKCRMQRMKWYELNQVLQDSIQQFKKESEEKIITNGKSIDEFKARIANEKMETNASFEKILIDLEQKNSYLR